MPNVVTQDFDATVLLPRETIAKTVPAEIATVPADLHIQQGSLLPRAKDWKWVLFAVSLAVGMMTIYWQNALT